MYHYVYEVRDAITNQFYIGSRSCKCEPNLDKYQGSMYTWKLDKESKSKLKKTIIKSDFTDRNSAVAFEAELIKSNITDELNMNDTIPDGKYHTFGKVVVKDKTGNIYCVSINDDRYVSGELVGINKGKIFTNEHKAKISWLGKHHNEDSKKKSSESQKGLPRTHKTRAKKIIQFDIEGNYIKEWDSLSLACKTLSFSGGNISNALNGKSKQSNGFIWRYA